MRWAHAFSPFLCLCIVSRYPIIESSARDLFAHRIKSTTLISRAGTRKNCQQKKNRFNRNRVCFESTSKLTSTIIYRCRKKIETEREIQFPLLRRMDAIMDWAVIDRITQKGNEMRSVAITAVIVAQAKAFPSSLVYPHNGSSSSSEVETFNQNVNTQWRLCAVCSLCCCVADRHLTADHFRLDWISIHFEFEIFVLKTVSDKGKSDFIRIRKRFRAQGITFSSDYPFFSVHERLDSDECSHTHKL